MDRMREGHIMSWLDDQIRDIGSKSEKNEIPIELYQKAVLADYMYCYEINLSENAILCDRSRENRIYKEFLMEQTDKDSNPRFDAYMAWIAQNYLVSSKAEFLQLNQREALLNSFERSEPVIQSKMVIKVDENSDLQYMDIFYIMMKEGQNGDVKALLLLYDFSHQIEYQEKIKQLNRELEEANYKIMSGQMQPHFLYNALAAIREIVLEDPEYASDLIYDFTTYLRACIRSMGKTRFIPFEQEIENIKAYVNIEKMRFGDRLNVDFDIRDEDIEIIPLSIQPLVENAIRHGIFHKRQGGGLVTVRSYREQAEFVIEVEDNGVGFDVDQVFREIEEGRRDSNGLKNLIFRLEQLLGAKVEIVSKIGEGTRITVRIKH